MFEFWRLPYLFYSQAGQVTCNFTTGLGSGQLLVGDGVDVNLTGGVDVGDSKIDLVGVGKIGKQHTSLSLAHLPVFTVWARHFSI